MYTFCEVYVFGTSVYIHPLRAKRAKHYLRYFFKMRFPLPATKVWSGGIYPQGGHTDRKLWSDLPPCKPSNFVRLLFLQHTINMPWARAKTMCQLSCDSMRARGSVCRTMLSARKETSPPNKKLAQSTGEPLNEPWPCGVRGFCGVCGNVL